MQTKLARVVAWVETAVGHARSQTQHLVWMLSLAGWWAVPVVAAGADIPGAIPAAFEVTPHGTAQYVIPIEAPPGTAGMAPKVALKYDSQAGNGVAGMGWTIEGLGAIARCARNYAQDNVRAGVEFTADDQFCLDGQRLVVVNGTYGAPGSEYRTEVDNYARILAVGAAGNGPAAFIVMLSDGRKVEYGNSSDSRWTPPGRSTPAAWSINKVTDLAGNYYAVSYASIPGTGQQLVSRIDYTGNPNTPALAPYNHIQFNYAVTRPDVETAFFAGSKISYSARLANIETYAGPTLAKRYTLDYNTGPATGRSRLRSIVLCGSAACLPATVFDWEDTAANFSGPAIDLPAPATEFGSLLLPGDIGARYWSDLNGDGVPDHCIVNLRENQSTGEWNAQDLLCSISRRGTSPAPMKVTVSSPLVGYDFRDVDGDGINDICDDDKCIIGSADGPTTTALRAPGTPSAGQFGFWSDINGDGRIDYCRLNNGGVKGSAYHLDCYLGTDSGFGAAVNLGTVPMDTCGPSTCETMRFSWVDVTGDGIESFCSIQGGQLHCRKWTPAGLATETASGALDLGEREGRAWADINGDGMADFCRVISNTPGQPSGTGHLACTLSTGNGFGETVTSGSVEIGYATPTLFMPLRLWSDVNGDGKADYCRDVNGSAECILSTGTGFSGTVAPAGMAIGFVGDVNGDGKPDICNGGHCVTSAGQKPDLLLKVTDGLGAWASVDYQPLSSDSLYGKGSGAQFPIAEIQDASLAVRRVRTSNGNGGALDTLYTYEGARTHQQGRGFLGYSAITSTNAAGIVTRTTYLQAFPYIGLVQETRIQRDAVILSDTVNTYAAGTGVPIAVFPVKTVVKTNDLNGTFVNWVETSKPATQYDAYGNARQVSTRYFTADGNPDGYSTTVTNQYQNDLTTWVLGQLTDQQIASTMPDKGTRTRTLQLAYFAAAPWQGLLKQRIDEPNNGTEPSVTNLRLLTEYTYDRFGNMLTTTVSGANITARVAATRTYDDQGRGPMTVKNALGHVEAYGYDWTSGLPTSLKGPNRLTTSWTYDLLGRKRSEQRADGTLLTIDYAPCTDCAPHAAYSVARAEVAADTGKKVAAPSRAYFDSLNREVLSVRTGFQGEEIYRQARYDDLGRLATQSTNYRSGDTIRWRTLYYDDLDRTRRVIEADNSQTAFDYDGRDSWSTDATGVVRGHTVNSQGQVVRREDASGTGEMSSMNYEYDHWGNLAKTTDGQGNTTTMEYDLRGRRTVLRDPDMGTWHYVVDNLGQVTDVTDAKGKTTHSKYDVLGRLIGRSGPDLASRWYYETTAAGIDCGMAIGKLCEATASNGYARRATYDALGRLKTQTVHVDADYLASWDYDDAGRPSTITYPAAGAAFPTGLVVKYNYTALGALESVTDKAGSALFWKRVAENEDGNITSEAYGNGLSTSRDYDPLTGLLQNVRTGTASAPASVQDLSYHFDGMSRLDERHDRTTGVGTHESFGYDKLGRLRRINFSTASASTTSAGIEIDAIGNITSKSGVGTYHYPDPGSARPHAVASVTGTVNGVTDPQFRYDLNGNMESDGARNLTWTSFNMPLTVSKSVLDDSPGSGTGTFLYGAEYQRVKQTWVSASTTTTTIYLNDIGFEKETNSSTGLTEYRHYVSADGRMLALQIGRSDGTREVRYLHPDHLGSTAAVTDAAGAAVERMAYDPWGDRRTASGAQAGDADPTHAIAPATTNRGFTGHEHLDLDNAGLVNMNGRIYDPTLARFVSADPYIAAPDSTQSFNRYSYVSNDPLNAIDPSGFEALTSSTDVPQVPVNHARLPTSFGFGWSVACADGCGQLFENFNNNRLGTISNQRDVTPSGKSGPRYRQKSFEVITGNANDGTPVIRYEDTWEHVPERHGTPEEHMMWFIEFDPFEHLATAFGASPSQAAMIGFGLNLIGNPKQLLERGLKAELHHICTNKNCISPLTGGPWTPRFKELFEKAGMTLEDSLNKIDVPGHGGPHPREYHQAVFDRLEIETNGLDGEAYRAALQRELRAIGREIQTPGTVLNTLITKP